MMSLLFMFIALQVLYLTLEIALNPEESSVLIFYFLKHCRSYNCYNTLALV